MQNIAEGSRASGTSKKTEIKLTNVARASLEELRLDYQDYLRQRGLEEWPPNHPALLRFKAMRCATLAEVRFWPQDERDSHRPTRRDQDRPSSKSRPCQRPCQSVSVRLCRVRPSLWLMPHSRF